MTFAFGSFTLGAALLFSAFKNMSLVDLIMGRTGESIAAQGESHPASSSAGGGGNETAKGPVTGSTTGLGDGRIRIPAGVPTHIAKTLTKGATQIIRMSGRFPYSWGGGHSGNPCQAGGAEENGGPGYDCSGCWSCVLHAMGIINGSLTSGGFAQSFAKGPGKYITLYANDVHVFGKFLGVWFGTGHAREAKRGGPAIGNHDDLAGYTVCHPKGW